MTKEDSLRAQLAAAGLLGFAAALYSLGSQGAGLLSELFSPNHNCCPADELAAVFGKRDSSDPQAGEPSAKEAKLVIPSGGRPGTECSIGAPLPAQGSLPLTSVPFVQTPSGGPQNSPPSTSDTKAVDNLVRVFMDRLSTDPEAATEWMGRAKAWLQLDQTRALRDFFVGLSRVTEQTKRDLGKVLEQLGLPAPQLEGDAEEPQLEGDAEAPQPEGDAVQGWAYVLRLYSKYLATEYFKLTQIVPEEDLPYFPFKKPSIANGRKELAGFSYRDPPAELAEEEWMATMFDVKQVFSQRNDTATNRLRDRMSAMTTQQLLDMGDAVADYNLATKNATDVRLEYHVLRDCLIKKVYEASKALHESGFCQESKDLFHFLHEHPDIRLEFKPAIVCTDCWMVVSIGKYKRRDSHKHPGSEATTFVPSGLEPLLERYCHMGYQMQYSRRARRPAGDSDKLDVPLHEVPPPQTPMTLSLQPTKTAKPNQKTARDYYTSLGPSQNRPPTDMLGGSTPGRGSQFAVPPYSQIGVSSSSGYSQSQRTGGPPISSTPIGNLTAVRRTASPHAPPPTALAGYASHRSAVTQLRYSQPGSHPTGQNPYGGTRVTRTNSGPPTTQTRTNTTTSQRHS